MDMSTDIVCRYFDEPENRVPVFKGQSYQEHQACWEMLGRIDLSTQFRRAAIAASLGQFKGQRTDCGRGPTPIQQFADEQRIGTDHLGRLAKTHRVFHELDDPEIGTLIADPFFSFKHFMVAATCSVLVKVDLKEAKQRNWSATDFAMMLAARRKRELLDANGMKLNPAANEDNDPDVTHELPERRAKVVGPPGSTTYKLLLTKTQRSHLSLLLQGLSRHLGTTSDMETMLKALEIAHRDWVIKPIGKQAAA